ncbi:MAG TPA: hypothetical protein PK431_06300 [Chitinophagales bacterium]|nr:hypothetical protein [Chitinophagales bacterium]
MESEIWHKFIETEKLNGFTIEKINSEAEKRNHNPILYDCALAIYEFDIPEFLQTQLQANTINVNEPTPRSHQSLLYLAVCKNRLKSCKLLIEHGADLNYKELDKNLLWWSVFVNANIEIVNMLLRNSIDTNAPVVSFPDSSLIEYAERKSSPEVIELLNKYLPV